MSHTRLPIDQISEEKLFILVLPDSYALIDKEQQERLSKYTWYLSGDNYASTPVGSDWWYMHRLVVDLYPGDRLYADHKDFDHLNNCKSNLRICTSKQSGRNRRRHIDCQSRYKGVKQLPSGKFMARIDTIYLGCFQLEIEAAEAYNVAALQIHGEFAQLNLV